MANREYRTCMTKNLRELPKNITKEQRKTEFCILSKTCSGKARNREEAKVMCSQPKLPKASKPKAPASSKIKKIYYDPDAGPPHIPDGYEVISRGT